MGEVTDNNNALRFHEALAQHFSLDELSLLCFSAGFNPDTVPLAERGIDLFVFCMVEAFRQRDNLASPLLACVNRTDVP